MITYTANVDNLRSTLYVSPQIKACWVLPRRNGWRTPSSGLSNSMRMTARRPHGIREMPLNRGSVCDGVSPPEEKRRVIWVRDEATILYDAADEPRYLNGASWDITERKSAEEKMRAISTEWRMTFDAISEAICLLDLEKTSVGATGRREIFWKTIF